MSIGSNLSGHWTDEELVNVLYGVGPEGKHLEGCADCQARLTDMRANRAKVETAQDVSFDFLAAQRRAIYQRIEQPARWWSSFSVRRVAAGIATVAVLTGSAYMYEQNRAVEMAKERAADAKLLQEVSAMAMDSGSASAEPLQGLFE
jgi:hypothetical protein